MTGTLYLEHLTVGYQSYSLWGKLTMLTESFPRLQLLPYFIMRVLAFPGLPGVFLACLFSGALRYVVQCNLS